jgi:hypothetical protein
MRKFTHLAILVCLIIIAGGASKMWAQEVGACVTELVSGETDSIREGTVIGELVCSNGKMQRRVNHSLSDEAWWTDSNCTGENIIVFSLARNSDLSATRYQLACERDTEWLVFTTNRALELDEMNPDYDALTFAVKVFDAVCLAPNWDTSLAVAAGIPGARTVGMLSVIGSEWTNTSTPCLT